MRNVRLGAGGSGWVSGTTSLPWLSADERQVLEAIPPGSAILFLEVLVRLRLVGDDGGKVAKAIYSLAAQGLVDIFPNPGGPLEGVVRTGLGTRTLEASSATTAELEAMRAELARAQGTDPGEFRRLQAALVALLTQFGDEARAQGDLEGAQTFYVDALETLRVDP